MLRRNNLPADAVDMGELNQFGFAQVGRQDDFEFNTMAGELVVTTADGVSVSILIGALLENPTGIELTLNYYLMLHAQVDESVFPVPERPSDEGLSEEESEKQNKAYLREVEQRGEKIEKRQPPGVGAEPDVCRLVLCRFRGHRFWAPTRVKSDRQQTNRGGQSGW
jgi:hypothetical protein